jgi:hypothetical protein
MKQAAIRYSNLMIKPMFAGNGDYFSPDFTVLYPMRDVFTVPAARASALWKQQLETGTVRLIR